MFVSNVLLYLFIYYKTTRYNVMVRFNWISCSLYLLIKLIDDAFRPLKMEVTDFGWSIDICQLDTHLAHQESVVLVGPVDSWTVHIIYLLRRQRRQRLMLCNK